MKAFHFGDVHQPLFGIYHPAEGARKSMSGVVLCNPYGEEAIRAHRIFRVLASRLARIGLHVLRFDYFGTGDSSGSSDDGTPARWTKDVLTAHDELVRQSGASEVTWVGLRYGANMALAASARPVSLTRLILWDPVLNGQRYLDELAESHSAYMKWELEFWRQRDDTPPQSLGWRLTDDFRGALERLDLSKPRFSWAHSILAILSGPNSQAESVLPWVAEGQRTRVHVVQCESPWNSDEALNSTLVPAQIVDAIVDFVGEQ